MFSSFFSTSIRNLTNNKLYTLINIGGLTLGITCATMIFLITRFELSFDNFHRDSERIYRVVTKENEYGNIKYSAAIPYPLPRLLSADFEEIEYAALTDAMGNPTIKISTNDSPKLFKEKQGYAFVNQHFFKIFNYQWISGNADVALKNENTVVLSRSKASKYFGESNPIGQTLELTSFGTTYLLTVTGLVEDVADNSDLPFNLLIHYNGEGENKRGWDNLTSTSGMVNCYIKLKPRVLADKFEKKIANYFTKYRDDDEAKNTELKLQPLHELHYDARFGNYGGKVIAKSSLFALGLIGLFLLLTACINFINLNTVLVTKRAKEVGIRKILGVKQSNLVWHFLIETALLTFLSMLLAFGTIEVLLVGFNGIFDYRLAFSPLTDVTLGIFLVIIFLLVSILSGLYPSFILSRFKPLSTLKSGLQTGYGKGLILRRGLIILQLVISQILIICVIVVSAQMQYFRNAPIGFEKEAILELGIPDTRQIPALNQQFASMPQVQKFCFSNTGAKSDDAWGGDFSYSNGSEIIKRFSQIKFIDTGYISTYEIKLIAGDNITIPVNDSSHSFLVNKMFVKAMGIDDVQSAIGENITIWSRKGIIKGVVDDFNTGSFHEKINPVIMTYDEEDFNLAALKITGPVNQDLLLKIETSWKASFPNRVFEYDFLDSKIANLYKQENRVSKMFVIATFVAIIIGCIGLFGLISFQTNQRSKEMGIRKVLGASSARIMMIFSKEFVWLTVIAFVIALPISWHYMVNWLRNFAYKIDLGPRYFLMGMSLTLIVTLITVSYKSAIVAITNPIDALKDE